MALQIILWIFTVLFALITFLPLVRNDYWTFRILEYPRLQKLILGLILLGICLVLRTYLGNSYYWILSIILFSCGYLAIKIFPYTSVAPKEMKHVENKNVDCSVKVFTANVLQDNREYHRLLKQIKQQDPDFIFLVETDSKWEEAMQVLEKEYPYVTKCPLDNTYGLLLYSRLPLKDTKVLFRVDEDVPSAETMLQLRCGVWVKVYGLHPKPPVPHESLHSTAKDKELMKIAFEVEKYEGPCIVMGDLNDVAWSHVTELFRKVSGLLDPRRGRGFYSTFSANHKWMQFPLDYIFCSSHFGLVSMKKMPHNGSDHYAMFIHLYYNEALENIQEEPDADSDERRQAAEKATSPVPEE
jgi:endonuclease/exonuclease/phosphatase (EEP) superfamily protein YafD